MSIDNMTTNDILQKGMETLSGVLGILDTERFIVAIQTESFDYTQWRRTHLPDESVKHCHQMILERCKENPIPQKLQNLPVK